MTKEATHSGERFLITPSLLNSWLWIWESAKGAKESERDIMSLEDKKTDAMAKAKEDFLRTLNRVPSEPNEYMLAGIQFERDCYEGKTPISPIIEGGQFQTVGKRNARVDGIDYLMYGRLDVLKGGIIYDIKRVWKYSPPKYAWSSQHGFYLDLFPRAKEFQYLIYDGDRLHIEAYYPDEVKPTATIISQFSRWLGENGLLDTYKEKWKSRH